MSSTWRAHEHVDAYFSEDGVYRYSLAVCWGSGPIVTVIGLNPSTADMEKDDHTVRKCVNWCRKNGAGTLYMLNLFPYRAKKTKDMRSAVDPFGEQTAESLVTMARRGDGLVIAAWGQLGRHFNAAFAAHQAFTASGIALKCWGHNLDGSPIHPCYPPLGKLYPWT